MFAWQVPKVELAGDKETEIRDAPTKGLFKVSYEPIKTHLLFHENTTLQNVLEDVVANVRKKLAVYFGTLSQNKKGEQSGPDVMVRCSTLKHPSEERSCPNCTSVGRQSTWQLIACFVWKRHGHPPR